MSEYKLNRSLNGHSGCKIHLMDNDNGSRIIRKISKDISYNERLRLQCTKQKSFHDPVIRTPQVLSYNVNEEGLFYFDMQYIDGTILSDYLRDADVSAIPRIVDILTSQMDHLTHDANEDCSRIFLIKIDDLYRKVDSQSALKALDYLSNYSWNNFPATPCHGDLTTENIIVYMDKLYFIDFLDSFYDCFILDFATLLQDVHCMWCYRFEKDLSEDTKTRLRIFRELLLKKLSTHNISLRDVYSALLLKLVRICPYVKDSVTAKFLNTQIENLLCLIKNY